MKIYADYHIHSKYSKNGHSLNEFEDIVLNAISRDLKEIAISDHGIRHLFFGTSEENIIKARKEIDKLNIRYPEINIMLGIEANLISYNGETDITDVIKENCDIIQMGIHYGVLFKGLKGFIEFFLFNFLAKFIMPFRKIMIEKNTNAVIKAMDKYNIDIITHPGDKIPVNIEKIAKKANETNTALEINNSHNHLDIEEIKTASKYGVKFMIGSDSHNYENIGKCQNSLERLLNSKIDLIDVINLEV